MPKISMVTLKVYPGYKKPIHVRSIEDACKWLNLSKFSHLTAYVVYSDGSTRKEDFKTVEEFMIWSKFLPQESE